MANLMRYDPFRELARFDPFREIDDFFRDFSPSTGGNAGVTPRMRMDIAETDQNYIVKAEIPGVSKEDIKVSINGSQVTLSAEVRQKDEQPGALRNERYYGQLYRSFTLPQEVDDDQAQARYENGVLQLTLPKRSGGGGRQLQVQ